MNLQAVLLVLAAPLPYWVLGLPWLAGADFNRIRLAPLAGCALAGLCAELALVSGLPVRVSVGVLLVASVAFVALRWRTFGDSVNRAAREWAPLYLVSVLAASLSPFPVLGNWSGDWLLLYQMGQAVLAGDLPSSMLARPPLFGAAAAPLWIVTGGLIPYQLMAAVASAAALTATFSFVVHFWPKSSRILLVPLILSPFFLHHTAAAWGKLLAAGLILAAVLEALRERRLSSAAFFALAVATHESSIIWAPAVALAHAAGPSGWRGALRGLVPMAALGLLIAGPLQLWILLKFGLAAKVASSPVLTSHDEAPFVLKSLLAIVTSFIGWSPVVSVARWLGKENPMSGAVVGKEAYWLVTTWTATMAGTLVGVLFPFVFVRRALAWSPSSSKLLSRWALAAVGFALVTNGLLTGFYSTEGTMQAGLVPLALALYGLLAGHLVSAAGPRNAAVRLMSWLMILVGTVPWFLANVGTSLGLWLSAGFRERFKTGSEGDYFRVLDNGLHPLGMAAFPEVPLLCATLLVALWLWHRRTTTTNVVDKDGGQEVSASPVLE